MRMLITVLIVLGALGAGTFVALYAPRWRGWYRDQVGQNLMAMAAVLCGLLTLWIAGRLVHLPMWVWAGGLASLDAVLWWRVAILWRIGHR